MFDLEQSIAEWRRQMLAAGINAPVPLEELESHLREEIERQMKSRLNKQQAFEIATKQIGQPNALKNEFKKTTMKTKYLSQRLGDITIMKTLNWKVVMLTFTVFVAIDAVLLTLSCLPLFHGTLLSIVWWIFNAPSFPLVALVITFRSLIPEGPIVAISLMICAGLFSSLVWSVVGGLILRRKHVAS